MRILLAASCTNIASVYRNFLLEYEEIDEVFVAQTIQECVDACREKSIDLTVVSVELLKHMPRADAILTASKVHRPKKVVVTQEVSGRIVMEAISYGFNDVIGLRQPTEVVILRLQMVMSGEIDLSQQSYVQGIRSVLGDENRARFANDEVDLQILLQLAYGRSNKEISEVVFLSLQTVRNRISRLMQVTKAQNRTQLALMFIED
jgi:NarL family two-component system response regulator LiaR